MNRWMDTYRIMFTHRVCEFYSDDGAWLKQSNLFATMHHEKYDMTCFARNLSNVYLSSIVAGALYKENYKHTST
jgi:hypothetical protein